MADEVAAVKQFFDNLQVHLSHIWLRDCIQWCKEETLGNNYTIKDLQQTVFEQWILLDLRDVEIPCLSPNLSKEKKVMLNSNYCLQLMKVVDISKPKYWQLQRIRNEMSKNLEKDETASSKRVLMLTLSDGIQEVEAVEYKFIPELHINLTPGIKIRLMGPIPVRRGRLMLERHHVRIIGGEVDTLLVSNHAENILATYLNLPLNPNPAGIQENLLNASNDAFNNDPRQGTVPLNLANIGNQPSMPMNQNMQQPLSNKRDTWVDPEEEMKINEEMSNLMEMELEMAQSTVKPKPTSVRMTPDMFEDMEMADFNLANIDIPQDANSPSQNKNSTKTGSNTRNSKPNVIPSPIYICDSPEKENISSHLLEVESELFEEIDIDAHLSQSGGKITPKIEKPIVQQAKSSPSRASISMWTIEKLLKNLPNINNGKFRIKAKFKVVTEKLTLIDDSFHLIIDVEDGNSTITVKVHDSVVAKMAGCTAKEFITLKSSLQENSEAEAKIWETLAMLKGNLQKLDDVIEVKVNAKEKYPVLINIV